MAKDKAKQSKVAKTQEEEPKSQKKEMKSRGVSTENKRDSRAEYFFTFIIMFAFEQFMFHDYRLYSYETARHLDTGLYQKSNLPLTNHNLQLYLLHDTQVNMTDFINFVQVDVSDQVRDKRVIDPLDVDNLMNITEATVFSRVQMRRYIEKYFPERINWSGVDPIHNDTRERDTHRYYWCSKAAKDLIILSGKTEFTYSEVKQYFDERIILNYINELILKAIETFEDLLVKQGGIVDAYFTEGISKLAKSMPFMYRAYRSRKFIDMDQIYYQFADAVIHNDTRQFRENLANTSDFRTDSFHYTPLFNESYTINSFRAPEDPHIIWEEDYGNMTSRLNRLVRRQYLSQDGAQGDRRHAYLYEQRNINNTYIKRGIHITVRTQNGSLVNQEYGPPNGPYADSRKDPGKILWYTPQDFMSENYTEGTEDEPNFHVTTRDWDWEFKNVPVKESVYFQRIKRSNFLPRCLREPFLHRIYMDHEWIRCPYFDHGPVGDDFYKLLGIEKDKDYIFEYMNVW